MSQPSARKSSLGATSRRGPQKAHIPFRGDDLEHGKKTGKAINKVSRDADDFEPFQEVLDQAYTGGNGPRAPNNNSRFVNGKSYRGPSPIPEDRDDGELSMDLDSTHNSPSAYFNTTVAPQPSSAKRVGSSSRALSRGSDVDYDRVPSPKPASRRSSVKPLNPSRLRNEVQDEDGSSQDGVAYNDSTGVDQGQNEFDYHGGADAGVDESPLLNPRGNRSFTELAQNDEEEESDIPDEDQSPVITRTDKGKGRAVDQDDSEENEDVVVEDDIAAGLQEIEDQQYDEDDEEEVEPGPSHKRPRNDRDGSAPVSQPLKKPKAKRTEKRLSFHETINEDGLRRSQRRHYPPLEYWRQEKVVWGRREKGPDKGPSFVPVIKEIITIPKPPPQPLGAKKRKRGGTHAPRSKSKSSAPDVIKEEVRIVEVDNPEDGWDDETPSHGVIIDIETGDDVQRRVAFTAKMVNPVPAGNSNYLFQKIFGDGDFIAGGQLVIPPKASKPAKPTKDNTYIFYLIEGAVQFRVHRSTFILATGGMFLVPRGNQYYIENICQRDARLFFAQARKIVEGENQSSIVPRARTAPRSSSHGVASPKQSKNAKAKA